MIKVVLFDMDGVIVDSELLHKKAYYKMFRMLEFEFPVKSLHHLLARLH